MHLLTENSENDQPHRCKNRIGTRTEMLNLSINLQPSIQLSFMNPFLTSLVAPLLAGLLHLPTSDPKPSFEVGVYPKQHTAKLNVMVENHEQKRLNLRLISPKNEVVYQETVGRKTAKYSRKLDLGQLPDGVYQLQVSDGQETVVREVNVSTKKVEPIMPEKLVSVR